MRKFLYLLFFCVTILTCFAADPTISLYGRVKTAITNQDLTNAYVLLYDSAGNVTDSIRANQGMRWRGPGEIDTMSTFALHVPRVDTTLVFDVVCEGFKPQTVIYKLEKINKRESYRELPVVYMQRAPIQLKEVTVASTKIKFYNKGDTTVYDASAFELAEGSMLDALIAQLPGAELSTDGQIKINGQFVESLLLDGKQFFDGNNNLMLENIAAYTVKDISVYEAQTKKEAQMGTAPNKILTMNVRLKKEYNIGWILNLQGGYGTKDRYTGRAFISWFNPKWRVSLVGNVNNLNDNRQPGRNDTWTPEMLPSGKKEFRSAGINYNFSTPDENTEAEGSLMFRQTINNVITNTDRINFLQGGDTYERSFANNNDRQTSVNTNHYFYKKFNNLSAGVSLAGGHFNNKNLSSNLSGAFNEDPGEMTRQMLEAIYSDGSTDRLESIINRSATKTDNWNHGWSGFIAPYINYKLPNGVDRLFASFSFDYQGQKNDIWKDYEINYGPEAVNTEKLRQFFDNSPNVSRRFSGRLGYSTQTKGIYANISYELEYQNNIKDSYMYALDHLNDMGVYGQLPSNYLLAFDPANSYTSHHRQFRHNINVYLSYFKGWENSSLQLNAQGTLSFFNRMFSYWRNNKDYQLHTHDILFYIPAFTYSTFIFYNFGKYGEGRNTTYRNSLRYSYYIAPTMPNMFDMVDVVDDSDPLNIYYGNPDLKPSLKQRHQAWWFYKPESIPIKNDFSVSYTKTDNEQLRGYTYNTATGVRYNRMYNVNGNHTFAISDNFEWQFGHTKQFTMSYGIDAGFSQSADMIGVNTEVPELTRVRNNSANQRFKLSWQIGKQNIGIGCDMVNRRTTSTQEGFSTLNATHVNAGIRAVFVLPAGFGISTDFMSYTRRGYGVSNLDTSDLVWNMRLSYAPPRNTHWVFMIDGFDMLHQLSNVNYAVTASGRTISYTNNIPRYVMFSAQYRLNIQPKRK